MNTSLLTVIALAVVLFVGIGGALLIYTAHTRQRKPFRAINAPALLTAPPADLAPVLAGRLVDKKTEPRHILAALIDLARRDMLHIHFEPYLPYAVAFGSDKIGITFQAAHPIHIRLAAAGTWKARPTRDSRSTRSLTAFPPAWTRSPTCSTTPALPLTRLAAIRAASTAGVTVGMAAGVMAAANSSGVQNLHDPCYNAELRLISALMRLRSRQR
jgi:hypothetical protein